MSVRVSVSVSVRRLWLDKGYQGRATVVVRMALSYPVRMHVRMHVAGVDASVRMHVTDSD